MRATTKTTIAGLVATGGLALAFASPAQAAVPSDLCAPGATFVVDAGEGIDPALATSVHDALTARGLTAAAEDDADLTAVIAPASEVVDGGDASVMAVALAVGELDPATAIRDTDWAPVLWSDGATPVNALLDTSCGTVDAVTDSAESSARTTVPAAPQAVPAAPQAAVAAPQAAPAAPEVAAAAPAAPAAPQTAAVTPQAAVPAAAPAAAVTVETQEVASARVSLADKDCKDFMSQADAQAFFAANGGPAVDPHRLDADDDAIACESHFAGDDAAPIRAEARMINAGVPDVTDTRALGLLGGLALVLSGVGVAVRARRLD